jgi:DNA-binding beta-propeller fold protein YncE
MRLNAYRMLLARNERTMKRWQARWISWAVFLGFLVAAHPAHAIEAQVPDRAPSVFGAPAHFRAVVTEAVGVTQYRWDFGDGERTEYVTDLSEVEHTYAQPGHYSIIVIVRDEASFTSVSFVHTVHRPLLAGRPSSSASIVYDPAHDVVCNVNPDSDTVSFVDVQTLQKIGELAVYGRPQALAIAPGGKLWVVHRDDYAVAIIDLDSRSIERGFRLPYASQPMGIAMSPAGDAAYVTLMAAGKLAKLNPDTGEVVRQLDVGPWPRGVAVSQDGENVYVTRFISAHSPGAAGFGEVLHIAGSSLEVLDRIALPEDTSTADTDQGGRGIPNYLFAVGLTPDGGEAWVPTKKDNMARGILRDGLALNQDNTVRPSVSVINLETGTEDLINRIDLDDRNLPVHVEFSPLGDYAFVSVTGSSQVTVLDAYTKEFVTTLRGAGLAPSSSVLTPRGRLFMHGALSRSVVVYDVVDILSATDQATRLLAEIPVVEVEKLSAEVLLGKRIFYNSEDQRMSQEGYLSCATCHFEGFEDGRVWDFRDRGEGFRNTTSLLGRRGTGQGPVHWTGNFDEIQDFEGAIRNDQLGTGFIADPLYLEGTHSTPLGDPKIGLSPDLDALSAYVTSLAEVNRSPFRNADGTLTADGEAGRSIFERLECATCHAGPDFTDSAQRELHDVGTLKETSGLRLGEPLLGIDTPTLLGVWETAPYLHDGSALTLRDVLTTANPEDRHGAVSTLQAPEIDQLVAYLQQLDGAAPARLLPFEEPARGQGTVPGGEGTVDVPQGGPTVAIDPALGPMDAAGDPLGASTRSSKGGVCTLAMRLRSQSPSAVEWLGLLGLVIVGRRTSKRCLPSDRAA